MQIAANLIGGHEGSNRLNFGQEQATVIWSAVGRLSETHRTGFSCDSPKTWPPRDRGRNSITHRHREETFILSAPERKDQAGGNA